MAASAGFLALAVAGIALLVPWEPADVARKQPFVLALPAAANWTVAVVGSPRHATTKLGDVITLGIDTRGSADGVHIASLRSQPFPVTGLRVATILDWKAPENASYRSAGIRLEGLCGSASFEVVGVPPGRTARLSGSVTGPGPHPRAAVTDGWPTNRAGRAFGKVRLELEVLGPELVFREDGREVGRARHAFSGEVRVVLVASSHSNFEERSVTFENIEIATNDGLALGGKP